MGIKIANNAYGTLSAGILSTDLTFSLTAGHGARFPSLGATDYFYATLVNTSGTLEIIKVTARATDALTVVRGLDGTTALAYSAGDRLELRPCNATLLALAQEAVYAVVASGTDTYTATLAPVPTGLSTDIIYAAKIPNANTLTNPTINFNSFGAKTIVKGNGAVLSPGDMPANSVAFFHWNGSTMDLLNPAKGVLRGKQTIWVPAGAMIPRTSNGPAGPNTTESATNKINLRTLDFATAVQSFAQFAASMPKGWDLGTITAKFVWDANSTSTNSVVWGIQGVALRDNVVVDTALGTAVEVTQANRAVANTLNVSADTAAVTIGNTPAARDLVIFQVYRKGSGADTLAATALLIGVELTVTFSAADDS